MKKTILILLIAGMFMPKQATAQNFNWASVPYSSINPYYYSSKGSLKLKNGDLTNENNLLIDFDNRTIIYTDEIANISYTLRAGEISHISLKDYKDNEQIAAFKFFFEIADEVGAYLRKNLYNSSSLNQIKITSLEKKGFFSRSKPEYYVDSNGLLDVKNKSDINCKILSISPSEIEYLDSDGDLWARNTRGLKSVRTNGESLESKRDKVKEARTMARVLNIVHNGKRYMDIRELYNEFYREYEENYYKSVDDFKSYFIGKNILEIVKSWGPFSNRQQIDSNTTQFQWIFLKSTTESYSKISSTTKAVSSETSHSSSVGNAYLTSNSTSSVSSSLYLDRLGIIVDSYGSKNERGFLSYYSKNSYRNFGYTLSLSSSVVSGNSSTTDTSSKIGVIVNENNIITEVITKNFFDAPKYGTLISFVD